jgi:hypothetical protein
MAKRRKPQQPPNLEFAKARLQRDAGMATAAAAEGAEFAIEAYATLLKIARRQPTVHVDDVLAAMRIRPQHPNSWGRVWVEALRNKVIEPSGATKLCQFDARKNAHRYPVYRSLIYGKSRFATLRK